LPKETKQEELAVYEQVFEIDENQIKRGIWKHSKSGNFEEFLKFLSYKPILSVQLKCKPCCFSSADLFKPDLEGKTAIHHILMNAHTELLDYIVREFGELGLTFCDLMPLEGNNALHLALSASGFGKYRARCVECFKLVVNFENERVAKAEAMSLEDNNVLDLLEVDRLGRTVYHIAAMNGLHDLLTAMLDGTLAKEASPLLMADIENNYPIHYAIDYRQPESFRVLFSHEATESILTQQDGEGNNLF